MARGPRDELAYAWALRGALASLVGSASGCQRQEAPAVPLTVFAASSLTDVLGALEPEFEAANPDVDVALSFAGSQVLRLQIEASAPADVFLSADPTHVQALVDAGRVEAGQVFARNELVVIVPPDNPAGIESLADLPRAQRLVVGTAQVPVGRYTATLLRRANERYGADFEAKVRASVVSEESNVRLVRAKVELGEADAAIVYRSDARASDRVRVVSVPPELNVVASYEVGVVSAAAHSEQGRRFVGFLRSAAAATALRKHGFVVDP
ncbi:MAG: molybdate ABC transporter substrate-binding protein [Myxococcota bacterium]